VLLLLFEQLNQHHKRAAYLGQGPNFAKRTHRPLSKDPNFSKKNVFFKFSKTAYQNHKNGGKKDSLKNKHGLMLVGKKKHQKTARDIN
jgi:hypothetical protein